MRKLNSICHCEHSAEQKVSVARHCERIAKQSSLCNNEILKQVQDDMILPPRPLWERVSEGRVRGEKAAFTLAEVLITLGIIGVVAAITLPALITNIQDRVKEKRVQNIQQKFSKATDKMLSISGLNGYESTLDFVNELKNHLSIAKICENDELRNCWPTEKVTLSDGTEWEISKTTKAKNLKMEDKTGQQWDDTVGLITGDGTAMILSYNTKCDIEPTATSTWTSDKSSSTNCIAAVFDWNGSSKPNQFGTTRADVLTFNAGGLGTSCAIEVEGLCLVSPIKVDETLYTTLGEPKCEDLKDSGYGSFNCYWGTGAQSDDRPDYWAVAIKQCGGKDKIANDEDLAKLSDYIYGVTGTLPTGGSPMSTLNITEIETRKTSLGFPVNDFHIWSSTETNKYNAEGRIFYHSYSQKAEYTRGGASGNYVLCKSE